jgi:hypothetical protein
MPMEMFLMVGAMSLMGVAVCAALFAAATRDADRPAAPPAEQPAREVPRFFADEPYLTAGRIPIEALLLQIERHVQLEQAAAESFHFSPTVESLHGRTMSPLVH